MLVESLLVAPLVLETSVQLICSSFVLQEMHNAVPTLTSLRDTQEKQTLMAGHNVTTWLPIVIFNFNFRLSSSLMQCYTKVEAFMVGLLS